MALDPKKVFVAPSLPKSSRTDAQRAASEAGAATTDKSDKITAKQFLSLNKSIFAINSNLNAIADLIKEKAQADADSDRDDKLRRDRDADAKKKGAAEKMLEGVLSNAVVKPLKTVQKTTSNIFEKLFEALSMLFAGYVGMKGVDGIKDWLEGDRSSLKKLAIEVGLVLTAAAGVFTAINVGIPLLVSGIGGVVSAFVGGLPGIFSLLGNPYVWMGVIAAVGLVYTGTTLYDYLRGEFGTGGLGIDGRGSYSNPGVIRWMDRVSDVGIEQTQIEMDENLRRIAEKYPEFFDWKDGQAIKPKNQFMRIFAQTGSMMDADKKNAATAIADIIAAQDAIRIGKWDRFDIAKLSQSDQQALNQIMGHVSMAKKYWEEFKAKQMAITTLMEGRPYVELDDSTRDTVDMLLKDHKACKDKLVASLKEANALEDKMSGEGQDFLNGIAQKYGITRLFERKDGWFDHIKIGPILSDAQALDSTTPGMKQDEIELFDKVIKVDAEMRRLIPIGLERAGWKPEDIGKVSVESGSDNNSLTALNNNNGNGLTNTDIKDSSSLYASRNLSNAEVFSNSGFVNDQKFDFVPIDFSEDSNVSSEVFNAKGYDPAIFEFPTSNYFNDDYISLFESQIGVHSNNG